jgi:hypothetical protein
MNGFSDTRVTLTGVGATVGTATTVKTGSVASFNVQGAIVQLEVARDLTIAVGDVCLIQRTGSQWMALQRLYTAAPADPGNPTLPNPQPASVEGQQIVPAVETRSYRAGWVTAHDDVLQGDFAGAGNYTGCAFYGSTARALEGATITAATMLVRRKGSGGLAGAQTATLRLVTESTRPSGAPTLTSSATGPSLALGEQAAFAIPTSWIDELADGTAGGIAIYDADGDPYMAFDGRGALPSAWTLTIAWTR